MKQVTDYIVYDIETTGLNPLVDNVTCICARTSDGQRFVNYAKDEMDESRLIHVFINWLTSRTEYKTVVTFNGIDFDNQFLAIRAGITGRENDFMDFVEDMRGREQMDLCQLTYPKISLSNMAKLFGLKKMAISGKVAITIWKNAVKLSEENKLKQSDELFKQLTDYCMADVVVTERLYQKILELQ